MAHEAVLVVRQEEPWDFICADGTGIEKGTLLKLTDPRTCIINSGSGDKCAGIAAREKIADSGRTRISVFSKGVFRVKASGAIVIGAPLMLDSTANHVTTAVTVSGAAVIGYSLEAAADADVFEMVLNVGAGGAVA